MGKRGILILLGVAVVLAMVAFGPQVVAHFTKKPPSTPALATAATRSFPVTATGSGTLQPESAFNVNFAMAGSITEIDASVGQAVQSGDVLAKIDDSTQQAEIQAAQASLASALSVLSAAQAGAFVNNPAAVPQAQAAVAAAQLQLQKARTDEAKTVLTAPVSGTVLSLNGVVGGSALQGVTGPAGQQVTSGSGTSGGGNNSQPFVVIGQSGKLIIAASFSQQDTVKLQGHQSGTATFDAVPGLTLPVAVATIATNASQVNGVPEFLVDVTLTSTDPRLRVGMSANVSLVVAQATDVVAVPNTAIYIVDNVPHVDVWFKGRAVPTVVGTGLIGDELTQVTSGLSQGQQVVLSAQQPVPTGAARPTANPQ